MASYSLQAYSLGLGAFMLIQVLAPGYYARLDMMTPVATGIKAMVANVVLNLAILLNCLKHPIVSTSYEHRPFLGFGFLILLRIILCLPIVIQKLASTVFCCFLYPVSYAVSVSRLRRAAACCVPCHWHAASCGPTSKSVVHPVTEKL